MKRWRFEMLLLGDRIRDDWKALRVLGPWRYFYSTFIYRPHMRWLHKRGQHALRTYGPIYNHPDERGAAVMLRRCDWCGFTPLEARSATAMHERKSTDD